MYLGAGACFLGSAGYLYTRRSRAGTRSRGPGAEVAVAMGLLVMITGPLWAAKAWGIYWTWDPRLTTALLSVLLYVAYVVLARVRGRRRSGAEVRGGARRPRRGEPADHPLFGAEVGRQPPRRS